MSSVVTRTSLTELRERWRFELDDYPIAVAWSPRAPLVAAAASSGPIALLDATSGELVRTLAGHDGGTMDIGWNASGTLLGSGGQDGCARIWDVASGENVACEAGVPWVEHVAFDPLGGDHEVLAIAAGRVVSLWSARGEGVRAYAAHPSTVSAIAWKPGRRELLSAAYGALTTWLPERDRRARVFRWKGSILSIACSRDGRYIATGDQDRTVHFWRTSSGEDLQMSGYPMKVLQLAWDASSRFLATGGSDVVTVWDCRKSPAGTRPRSLEGHEAPITGLAFQHAGSLLASCDAAGGIAMWDLRRAREPLAREQLDAEAVALAWEPGDGAILAASSTGRMSVLDAG